MKCKFLKVVAFFMTVVCVAFIFACTNNGTVSAKIVAEEEQMVVIKIENADGAASLMDTLNVLKEDGKLQFEESQGMIISVNGKAGETISATEGYSWFLYTSDVENSNDEWGTVEYDGKTYGSAIVGADMLKVVSGELYILSFDKWSY